ncbi:MAG: thiamine-phosphate kinase [Hyphomonadaceae bacterium]
MDEFDLIRTLFAPLAQSPGAQGLTDDVAELTTLGRVIVTTDTIVEGVHFRPEDPLDTVAAKLVRVNVSDVLAKGAEPREALLNLTWPKGRDAGALAVFAKRFGEELAHWGARLVGGDTTATDGPLVLSLTLTGVCAQRGPVRRSGAQAGDEVWVTGTIGDGWLGLQAARGRLSGLDSSALAWLESRYRVPETPPLAVAALIATHATASMDVSDGLVADAEHLASASGVAMKVEAAAIPVSAPARTWLARRDADLRALLTGGDDYQCLFTAPPQSAAAILEAAAGGAVEVARIGRVLAGAGVEILDPQGEAISFEGKGWRHSME